MNPSLIASSLAVFGAVAGIALGASGNAIQSLPKPEIFVVNADGTGLRNLTRSPARDDLPVLAPDGRRLVFIRDGDLWKMNADGAEQRRLADASGWTGLSLSPDGSRIAFSRFAVIDSPTPYVREVGLFELDGKRLRSITDAAGPTWAPDGKRLAFNSEFSGFRQGPYAIAVANNDGSARRVVVRCQPPPGVPSCRLPAPHWSPKGSLVAFGLSVVDVDDPTNVRRLAPDGWSVAWSPDGRRLAFRRDAVAQPSRRGKGIWIVSVDGSGLRMVVSSKHFSNARNPTWSPDGKRVAFNTSGGNRGECDAYCPGNLLVVNLNRGRPRIVARRVVAVRQPIWSRDGRKVYFVGYVGPRRR